MSMIAFLPGKRPQGARGRGRVSRLKHFDPQAPRRPGALTVFSKRGRIFVKKEVSPEQAGQLRLPVLKRAPSPMRAAVALAVRRGAGQSVFAPPPSAPASAAYESASGPKSAPDVTESISPRRARARLIRLLMVPRAQPQISAASS